MQCDWDYQTCGFQTRIPPPPTLIYLFLCLCIRIYFNYYFTELNPTVILSLMVKMLVPSPVCRFLFYFFFSFALKTNRVAATIYTDTGRVHVRVCVCASGVGGLHVSAFLFCEHAFPSLASSGHHKLVFRAFFFFHREGFLQQSSNLLTSSLVDLQLLSLCDTLTEIHFKVENDFTMRRIRLKETYC